MALACVSFSSAAFVTKPRVSCFSSAPDFANSSGSCRPRPAVILPGLGNNSGDYEKLQMTLMEKGGVPSVVAKVSRLDWFRNAAGLADANYWKGTLSPRPVLDWYLKRVDDAVQEAKELGEGGTLSVIGHSAGGWLARVYMEEFGRSGIALLLTLGTPHLPPPKGLPGVIDQTRGLLYYVEERCAKPVYTPELKYVCIAGRYIQGAPIFGASDVTANPNAAATLNDMQPASEAAILSDVTKPATPTMRACFVGQGYKQVCGRADVWGDGVVPEVSAHMEGALNISLDGVFHSPVGSDDELRPWYGSPAVVDQWIHHLLLH
uniref:GPI inositol-deacylase n=1 Tax=Kalanchoe fedtschenkoi TaxID=63787 RepID=A0A7N0T1Y3_KALFE